MQLPVIIQARHVTTNIFNNESLSLKNIYYNYYVLNQKMKQYRYGTNKYKGLMKQIFIHKIYDNIIKQLYVIIKYSK